MPTLAQADEGIGVRQAAEILRVHENTIRNWVKEGRLTDTRVEGTYRLRLSRAQVEQLASMPDPRTSKLAPDVEEAYRRGWAEGRAKLRREITEALRRAWKDT